MPNKKHNQPPVVIEVTPEIADFIIENCDANIRVSMNLLQQVHDNVLSEKTGYKAVELIEKFKELKKQVEQAKKER